MLDNYKVSEVREPSKIFNKFCGFTLAEVLITLAIIGVVAALTIPSVVQNYRKTQTVTQLKKIYNTLNQVIYTSQVDIGNVSTWNTKDEHADQFFSTYLKPYLKIRKDGFIL